MRSSRRTWAAVEEELQLSREEIRLSREEREETREFIRETTVRMDRIFRDLSAVMQEQIAAFRALAAEVRDGRDEQRAQTQALLRLIDRMDGLEPGGATG
jgi:hypothetical protein